jgi:hypothetical protein
VFVDPATLKRHIDVDPPALPWIAGHALESGDIGATGAHLRAAGLRVAETGDRRLIVSAPADMGGFVIFEPGNSGPPAFD